MKLGFVSSILGDMDFYKMIDTANEMGFKSVEVYCWPNGKVKRTTLVNF